MNPTDDKIWPALPKSYKGVFPFKIGTTSYIYPAGYSQNVKMLAPYVDEIELLLFESTPDSLPPHHEIKKLLSLSKDFDLTYNVHLPTDISLSDPEASIRHAAVETLKKVMNLTSSLAPSTYTLHLSYDEKGFETECIKKWRDRLYRSIGQFIATGIASESISVETLTYPFEWVEQILIDFNLSVCMDLGHLMVYGFDMETVFNRYGSRTSIIHLHGVDKTDDHLSLDRLSKKNMGSVIRILQQFKKVVSLEVFSYDHLKSSLKFLEKSW
jgi:sugar phosphate isomerase/epimerase